MKLFAASLRINCKLARGSTGFWAILLLLAVCLCLFAFTGDREPLVRLDVGICLEAQNTYHSNVFDRLPQDRGIRFLLIDSVNEEWRQRVASGELECIYVLEDSLRESIREERPQGAIRLIRSPRTVADTVAGDMLFAAILAESTVDIAANELERIMKLPSGELQETLTALTEPYRSGSSPQPFVETRSVYHRGGDGEPAPPPPRLPHGIAALASLLAVASLLPRCYRAGIGLLPRLAARQLVVYWTSVWSTLWLGALLAQLLGMPLCRLGGTPPPMPLLNGMALAVLYSASVALAGCCLLLLLPRAETLYLLGPFLLLLFLFFGEFLFDWAEISSTVDSFSSLLPSSAYLGALLLGEWRGAALLALSLPLFGGAALLLLFRRKSGLG